MTRGGSAGERPSDDELQALGARYLWSTEESDRAREAVMLLYLFLPLHAGGMNWRSSLEALLTDARGSGGRNLETGEVQNADHCRSWLSAMGYLALVDQLAALLDVPADANQQKGTTAFERLLLWDGAVTSDEAAAVYGLRCAVVHGYGLLNDPRGRGISVERKRALLHMFRLSADGGDLVRLGDRTFPMDVSLGDLPETCIDLRTLASTIERLVTDLRSAHMEGEGLAIRPDVPLAAVKRACFFFHSDPMAMSADLERAGVPGRRRLICGHRCRSDRSGEA